MLDQVGLAAGQGAAAESITTLFLLVGAFTQPAWMQLCKSLQRAWRTSISPEASNATLGLFTSTGQSCENEMRNASSVRPSRSERASRSCRRCCDYWKATGCLEAAGGRGLARVCEHFLRPPTNEGTMANHRSSVYGKPLYLHVVT